jgi:hypothetical protein
MSHRQWCAARTQTNVCAFLHLLPLFAGLAYVSAQTRLSCRVLCIHALIVLGKGLPLAALVSCTGLLLLAAL